MLSTLFPKPLAKDGRLLAYGLLLTFSSSFGQTYFIGVYRPDILMDYGLSESDFGLLYLGVTLGSALGVNLMGHLIDRIDLRHYTAALVLALSLSAAFVGLAGSFYYLVAALTLVRLFGQGMMVHAAMTTMTRYFEAGRGTAVAVAGLGMPVAQSMLPAAAVWLMGSMAWQDTWLVLALGLLGVALPFLLWLLAGHDQRHKAWADHTDALERQADSALQGLPSATGAWRRRHVLRDWRFYLILPAIVSIPFWMTAMFFFAERLAVEKGWTFQAYTGLYWTHAAGASVVPFVAGVLVDRFGGLKLLALYPPVLALGLAFVAVGQSAPAIVTYMMLTGVALGLSLPVNNALWAELYGTRHLGEIKSLTVSIIVVSTALAPWIIGAALDRGVPVEALFWLGVGHALISVPLLLPVLRRPVLPPPQI